MGVKYRLCRQLPLLESSVYNDYYRYVQEVLVLEFDSVNLEYDEEGAIVRMNQPWWRKMQYFHALEDVRFLSLPRQHRLVKVFTKNETYEDDTEEDGILKPYKYHRGIYARVDQFKMYCGLAFQTVSEVVFHHPDFIKKIDVRDRPNRMVEKLVPGWHAYETDFTSMEGSISKEIFDVEFLFYRHILPGYRNWNEIYRVLTGKNKIRSKDFQCSVNACRMSGEMNTSVGNGLINWSLLRFIAYVSGADIRMFVEGDDGIMTTNKPLLVDWFAKLGFKVKLEEVPDFRDASFCGLRMSRNNDVLVDPRKILVNFSWSSSKLATGSERVRQALLRGKAQCLLYEYPNCPIVTELGKAYVGEGPEAYAFDWYHEDLKRQITSRKEETIEMVRRGISYETRLDFERFYQVPIDLQLRIESELRSDKENFRQPGIQEILSRLKKSKDYYERFTSRVCDRHSSGWIPGMM